VEPLLEKAVRVDPQFAETHLQLGIVHAAKKNYEGAVADYLKAIELSPALEEAHYRLALVYRQMSEPAKAQEELAVYHALQKRSADRISRERAEIQQFVVTDPNEFSRFVMTAPSGHSSDSVLEARSRCPACR
jgi:tetratricopeptide (TPR) repeat protein